ncbi:kinase-like domain-containing protein, partial [Zopfochytrium polystomum]
IEWRKGKLIGRGSFAQVFYGVNLTTSEIMAVKQVELIPAKKGAGTETSKLRRKMAEALKMEIRLLRELDHPHVVRYLGFDIEDNVISVFLQYVEGGSIASMLATYGAFETAMVRSFTSHIVEGLRYLHDRCIIHRDIKGANLLVDGEGLVRISDFGISKKSEYKLAYKYDSRMSLQGSVFWMAPEVIKGKGYSAKVDIWSLGCVVLEMLTGHHPWEQLNEMQTMWRLGKENAPPLPSTLEESARQFLGKCYVMYGSSFSVLLGSPPSPP